MFCNGFMGSYTPNYYQHSQLEREKKNYREHEDILLRRQVIHIVLQELIKLYSLLLNQYVIIAM